MARKQNEWLSSEARQTEDEIQQYEAYMSSKTQREIKKLKSLSEHNAQELGTIAADRKHLEDAFLRQKQGARCLSYITTSHCRAERRDWSEAKRACQTATTAGRPTRVQGPWARCGVCLNFQVRREEQEEEIRALEKRLEMMISAHNDSLSFVSVAMLIWLEMALLKTKLLNDRLSYQRESLVAVRALEETAKKASLVRCWACPDSTRRL